MRKKKQDAAIEAMIAKQRESATSPNLKNPEHLKEWRLTLGISQQQLAEAAKVSQALIAQIETRRHDFCEPFRSRIWQAMEGFTIERLLAKQPDKYDPRDILSFYAIFFGKQSLAALVLGLEETPRERAKRQYEMLQWERDEWRRRYESENERVRELLQIMNLKTNAALSEKEAQERIDALGLKERSQTKEEVLSEAKTRIRLGLQVEKESE